MSKIPTAYASVTFRNVGGDGCSCPRDWRRQIDMFFRRKICSNPIHLDCPSIAFCQTTRSLCDRILGISPCFLSSVPCLLSRLQHFAVSLAVPFKYFRLFSLIRCLK